MYKLPKPPGKAGAALLNATDKTLPVLKNQLADVGTAAITGANNNFKAGPAGGSNGE